MRPALVGGLPLLMVRARDGRLRVFHNVCRHRGLKLVAQPCSGLKMLTCPYHAWSYGLDGKLRVASHFGGDGVHKAEGLDYQKLGLVEVRSALWHDWVFVNIDGTAGPFEDHVKPLEAYIGDRLDLGQLMPILKIDSGEVAANWKFITENFIEPYHVPVTHSETAAGQPLKDHYMLGEGHMVGCGIEVAEDAQNPDPKKPAANGKRALCLAISAWYICLFPSFLFFVYFAEVTHVYVMINTPLAAGRTHQRRVIYQLGGEMPPQEEIEAWRKLNNEVIAEDWDMATRLQAGRASPVAADGCLLSPVWEASERAFDELIMNAMRA